MNEDVDWNSVQEILDSISYGEIQDIMDETLGQQNFDFTEYLKGLVQGGGTDTLWELIPKIAEGAFQSIIQDKKAILSLFVIAVIGAVFASFSKMMKGKQVADTAFLAIYILFYSILSASFLQITQLAAGTMEKLQNFMNVLVPTFMISLSFTQGGGAAGIYTESALMMVAIVNQILLKAALPAVNLYFFLRMADQLSQENMFTQMAELVHDLIHSGVKTMFALVMGMNVIQGLVVPVTAQVKKMAVTKMGSALPGVGNAVEAVVESVLCAGTLVKNAIGVGGVVVVFLLCAIPLLHMIANQFLYQLVAALIQPISDPRLVKGIGGMVDTMKLIVYIVGVGAMLFITFISLICAFTT